MTAMRRRRRRWGGAAAAGPQAPSLSSVTDTKTGQTTATITVDTNESGGTLYWVLSSSATPPSSAQVKAGQMHTGAAAAKSGSAAVALTGTQTFNVTALTAGTTYYAHFMHEDATALQSAVASGDGFTTDAVAAPVLSLPTDTKTGSTTATLTVSTTVANGTLYWVLSSSSTAPSAAQIKLGQMHTGAAAAKSGSQAVSGTGVQNVSATALTASTTYYAHFMHESSGALQSNVASGDGLTTDAAGGALLLDSIGSLSAVYSFRKLRTAYAGNCVRIRASGDNAETNIGFASNAVDNAAITAFIGTHGGSAFIVTLYDQGGGNLDITNATAANQPAYIASGINSLPTVRFDGTNDSLTKASVTGSSLFNSNETTFLAALKQDGTSAQNLLFNWSVSFIDRVSCLATYDDVIYWDFGDYSAGGRLSAAQPSGWDNAGHVLECYRATGGTQAILVDGASLASASRSTGPTVASSSNWMIASEITPPPLFKGDLSELILTKNDTGSTNRDTIRSTGVGSGVSQGMGPYYGVMGSGVGLLLDALGVSAARAYSMRKLRAAYAGSAIRIRRSSDNAEQDIGFSGENLDTAAITTFVGANSAFVVTMYDQSGTGDNATNATAANQPRIVNAGTLDTRNSLPCAKFDGANDIWDSTASFTAQDVGVVAASDGAVAWAGLVCGVTAAVGLYQWGGNPQYQPDGPFTTESVNNTGSPAIAFNSLHQVTGYGGSSAAWPAIRIGEERGSACWSGWVGEVVMFSSALSAGNRTVLYNNQKTYWGIGLLDVLGVSAARAYSMRKLRGAYTGSAIRIRRSSDNAEQDIGFSGENLDTAAITTFVGSNSAFVVKMYDQSGTGDDAAQATAANQPRIVNAGTLDTKNGLPAPTFDGTNDVLVSTSAVSPIEASLLASTTRASWAGVNDGAITGAAGGEGMAFEADGTSSTAWFTHPSFTIGNEAVNNGSNVCVFGGVLFQSNAHGTTRTWTAVRIGEGRNIGRYWTGTISEAILWATTELTSGNRAALYNNQKTYWGTP